MTKKLFFALPFLLSFYWFCFQLTPFFKDLYLIFSLNLDTLVKLILLVVSLLITCLFFVIFATLANDWKIILPVSAVAASAGIILFAPPFSFILALAFLASFVIIFYVLNNKLESYVNFQASSLLNSSIKSLATLIILVTSLVFYFTADTKIKTEGFQIPDSLIETALKIAAPPQVQGVKISQLPNLTQDQIEFLKKNPQLLQERGIDPSILNSVDQTQKTTPTKQTGQSAGSVSQREPTSLISNEAVKNLIKKQLEGVISPYLKYIPPILAVLFFVTLQSLFTFISILLPLLVGSIFWILEKTNFVHFETETREVKKLVV